MVPRSIHGDRIYLQLKAKNAIKKAIFFKKEVRNALEAHIALIKTPKSAKL
jgi:hypothetical protein